MRERYGAKKRESWLMRFHTQTAGVSLTAQQPLNNVVRVSLQALAAVLGGIYSMHRRDRLQDAAGLVYAGAALGAIFAGDLFRMYARYAENRGWRTEILSSNPGEHGGYKEIIARVEGTGVFARLKFESGAHRVQRVPATEAQGRIHTSAATVAILPEMDEIDDIELNPADLKTDTFRASGAGGQHVNKTDSAIRITHLPTNIVVQCQNDRSQHRNRDEAWQMLRARIYEHELRKQQAEQQKLEDAKSDIGWGHQIRSYVLDQSRIKDLRTNHETGNTQGVLDGDLDPFIEASLKQGV